jgi:hypothetical protein
MPDRKLISHYLKLVQGLERLQGEMNHLQKEIQTVTDAMTDEELEEIGERLRAGQHAMLEELELLLKQRHSPPVE